MEKVAFFDAKPYDKKWFSVFAARAGLELRWLESRLCADTAVLAAGCPAAVAFVNDDIDSRTVDAFEALGVGAIALRCAGSNNVDLASAAGRLRVYCVPDYSPSAVAEHAAALLLSLCRRIHKAYARTREHNFSLVGLEGAGLCDKTAGMIGAGRVGQAFASICRGFGMKVIAYDIDPVWGAGMEYVGLEELLRRSDVISLHCPLTPGTYHIIDRHAFRAMKPGVWIINTSRGALIDAQALLEAVKNGTVRGAGLDVYEEEAGVFYEDVSDKVMRDDVLDLLIAQPNVLVTSHQAFFTDEALRAIAETTVRNLRDFFDGRESPNERRAALTESILY